MFFLHIYFHRGFSAGSTRHAVWLHAQWDQYWRSGSSENTVERMNILLIPVNLVHHKDKSARSYLQLFKEQRIRKLSPFVAEQPSIEIKATLNYLASRSFEMGEAVPFFILWVTDALYSERRNFISWSRYWQGQRSDSIFGFPSGLMGCTWATLQVPCVNPEF